jgi:3-hydroxyisobutyrate dehydrogenase-like beta-hydroxyacid dehydrogenase
MGAGMAANLLRAGHNLTGPDPTLSCVLRLLATIADEAQEEEEEVDEVEIEG